MHNEILTINLSRIKLKNITIHNLEHNTQNKSTNTFTTLINSNQRFEEKESKLNTINPKKNNNSYLIKNPKQKIFEFKKELKERNNDYYFLPLLSNINKSKSIKQNKEKKQNLFDNLQKNKIKIKKQKQKELVINPVSLYLFTLSNEKKITNKKIYSTRNKESKIKDEFLERIKDYRKRLKDQMIKRNKFQYSHSNNSLNNSQNQSHKKEKELDKEKEINNENYRFNYNPGNNYIFNMNENVEKALNIFYNKVKSSKIIRNNKNKSHLNSEKNLSSLTNHENNQNKFHTININYK